MVNFLRVGGSLKNLDHYLDREDAAPKAKADGGEAAVLAMLRRHAKKQLESGTPDQVRGDESGS